MKRTKIICTLGPATDTGDILKRMIANGMNVARLNVSHGDHEEHKKRIKLIKEIREELNIPIGILLDTKGPEVRIKDFENGSIILNRGDNFVLTVRDVIGNNNEVSVTYKNLPADVKKDDKILIDDGLIELLVTGLSATDITCRVLNGG
ncbi:MAG: pyruvate kinase, partial [Spirochaetes bacterium]|nr:pyruvate kinase [Spirochaetota bacterium]